MSRVCMLSQATTLTFKGGESSSQFRWFTIVKIELQFLIFFCFNFGAAVAKIFNKHKKISPEKVFGNSEFCSSRQNHSRPNRSENCGFGGKNKTQSFQKLFSGDIFLYLLNIFATAASKLTQTISKIIVQF